MSDGFEPYGGEAGRAKGHDTQSKLAAARRDKHTQRLEQSDVSSVHKFSSAQFVAFLRGDIKMNSNGTMQITFQVPFEYRHLALPMLDAVAVPLSVDVQVWRPYVVAVGDEMDLSDGEVK